MGLDNPIHLAFLLILLLLVFGAKRLPEMGRSLGSGMRGFKESLSGENTLQSLAPARPEASTADAGSPTATPALAPAVTAVSPRTQEPQAPSAA